MADYLHTLAVLAVFVGPFLLFCVYVSAKGSTRRNRYQRQANRAYAAWYHQQQAELYRRSQAGYIQPGHQR